MKDVIFIIARKKRTFTDLKLCPLVLPIKTRCRKGERWKLKKERRWAKINVSYISTSSPYRAVNTLGLSYKNQSVNAVYGNNRCLF